MKDLIVNYFNAGLYNANDLQVFVQAGELDQDTYNKLVGNNDSEDSASSNSADNSSSAFNPVK